MEIQQFRYFLTAARYENLTKAAEELHIAQPALSQSVKRLETELGVSLFDRKNHRIELNEQGKLLKKRLIPLMESIDNLKDELWESVYSSEGTIYLNFLSASNLMPAPIAWLSRMAIMAIRTVPAFVYGLMFIRVSGPGAFTGLLTMSVCSIGMVSKMYIEAIEDLDIRILESLDACGCNTMQKIRYGILPQLIPNFASTVIYRFDINLRDATVLGLVGAGGIGAPLIFAMNSYRWNEAGAILVGLIVLVLIVEYISTRIRVKLTRG